MRRVMVGLVMGAVLVGGPVAAQSPDAAALLATCQANAADDVQLATCEWVVGTVLAPDPAASPAVYGADLPGVGVTLAREDATVTLVAIESSPVDAYGERPKVKGNRFLSIRVLYQANTDGVSYNPFYWSLVDLDGFSYDQPFVGGMEPKLEGSNDLPAGRKAQGWITFEVPKNVRTFEVVEGQTGAEYLRWLVTEPE